MPSVFRPARIAPSPFTSTLALTVAVIASTLTVSAASATSPTPRDAPYPGVLTLSVDATDIDHRVFVVHETIPVTPGPLTLLFPRWLPGYHGPVGQPNRLAGLVIKAGEQRLAWQRDPVDPLQYHVDVPAGTTQLDLDFQHLNPLEGSRNNITATRTIVDVQWDGTLLYPAGYFSSRIPVQARLRLPVGWGMATGLRGPAGELAAADAQGWRVFEALSLEHLVDSPVVAGAHFKRIELDAPGSASPVALSLFGDDEAALAATPEQIATHRALVHQADLLFASRHFRHYDLMLWQSDEKSDEGLEHHESSENGTATGYFDDWDKAIQERELLPHEYTHSWNGKFRRPADLWTPNFNVPMQDSLLWVYEGQTQYWGRVLSSRSGLINAQQARDEWADVAAWAENRAGRQWRPLQDTTNDAAIGDDALKDWQNWQRDVDYYDETSLIWLEADMLIRQDSHGQRSLDDFAKRFFGIENGRIEPLTYKFEDVVAALNQVQPYDWSTFLRDRLDAVGSGAAAPLGGLGRAGWRLVYKDKESENARNSSHRGEKVSDFSYSIGLTVSDKEAHIDQVAWNSPAFKAGLAGGAKLLAVNMQEYKPERLAAAITANKDGNHPIELLVKDGEHYRVAHIDWRGGLRYPSLERIPGQPDLLSAVLAPR
jgi:predicted metalloprotease with PDZ domain